MLQQSMPISCLCSIATVTEELSNKRRLREFSRKRIDHDQFQRRNKQIIIFSDKF